ncbi:MAG: glycosyltransferase family 2 protein [Bdellovibrionales bacterium]|nr:glycosyltransferase family 2 protein [Bdellovibrionales bacterium]
MKLSITCIGHNEAYHLEELLPELLKWGDEVIYVDCESDDNSFEVAERLGCKAYRRPNNMNLNVNKSFAMDQTTGDWIFYVDPDERFDESLMKEVRQKMEQEEHVAYKLKRKNHFFGHWLKYGGQFPDTQLRIFKKGKGQFPNQHVHESLKIDGSVGYLENTMSHYPYLTISQFLKKMDFYSSFEADFLYKKGVRPSLANHFKYLFWKPKMRFFRRYFLKGGFRDGIPGFFAALFDGIGWSLRYLKLWEKCSGKVLVKETHSK